MFSMINTRLNIAYAMFIMSCFTKNLSYQYTEVVKTIVEYFKNFYNWEITFDGEEKLPIMGHLDFDWMSNKESWKSTSDIIFILNRGPVS